MNFNLFGYFSQKTTNDSKAFWQRDIFRVLKLSAVIFLIGLFLLNYSLIDASLSSLQGGCTLITDNYSVEDIIDPIGDQDCFTFVGSAGAFISAFGDNLTTGGSKQLNITLLDPSNQELASDFSPLAGWDVEINDFELPADGTYTIVMDGTGDTTGPYAFGFSHLNYNTSCISITDGYHVDSTIDQVGDEDCFTFVGSAGAFISAFGDNLTTGGSKQLNITLLDPSNQELASDFSPLAGWDVEINDFELPADGTYTIVMDGTGDTTGPYAFGFSCLFCPPSTTVPGITEVLPNRGNLNFPNNINIYGSNFQNGANVILGTTSLTTVYINSTHLRAIVPAGLPEGIYDVTVINPDSGTATLNDAYTVFDPETGIDDLYGFSYELFTDPTTPHAAETTDVFMTVHREGGQQVLSSVIVRFYQGDPAAGGTIIGDGTILFFSPRSSATTTAVSWTPPAAGEYALFAVIDPNNTVAETFEDNNIVSRVVEVWPPAPTPDLVAPHVDSFAINDDAAVTTSRDVTLDTTVSDPAPSSGVESVFYLEYEYSQAAGIWVPAQWSGWLDYESSRTNYPWKILPSAGVKYMQAWATDGAGNISHFPHSDSICYQPPGDSLVIGQTRVYRYTLAAGQTMTARVEPLSGDPDLYVWPPNHPPAPPWVSATSVGPDEVIFTATESGEYQVEIYAYTSTEYQLTVEITSNSTISTKSLGESNMAEGKPEPTEPAIPLDSLPGSQIAIPVPPYEPSSSTIYLPMIVR